MDHTGSPHTVRPFTLGASSAVKMEPSYKVDEGYSEETRSQEGTDDPMRVDSGDESAMFNQFTLGAGLQDAVLALGETERKGGSFTPRRRPALSENLIIHIEFAYTILRSLRVSSIASVVDQLWPLFHKDPVAYFPPELVSLIFSYLEPRNLMEASRASSTWRARVLDSRLWKEKFKAEGWGLDVDEIDRFEQHYNLSKSISAATTNRRIPRGHGNTKPFVSEASEPRNSRRGEQQHSINLSQPQDPARVQTNSGPGEDEEMLDATLDPSTSSPLQPSHDLESSSLTKAKPGRLEVDPAHVVGAPRTQHGQQAGSLMLYAAPGHSRLNYHYIFKQKRKLEENWNAGRYKSFQLPHKDHPEDAHTECVYTIQYLGKYLVSGSRDRTLRIWDLETLRLAKPPLYGHMGSVLCLQFDDQKDEDIIISGSSDCHVIIWCFSTGQKLKQLTHAHKESVLNLRFDKRFLVTCSKDKTIKIWNRQELTPGHRNYPLKGVKGGGQCPLYIMDATAIPDALRYGPTKPEHKMRLEPYTHIMTLDLHVAAVNAIQIYENQLVSASGDRCLRVWNIHSGECTTKIEAHQKGIACVQYDGKRIVSGSSDNTIRIWDPISKVEVARLEGHTRLVRTIQAAFVDVPGGRERLGADAADVEREYHLAHEAGLIPERSRRDPPARPGSRKPKDLRAINARIPPSGGGSRWSHIVSGSYDETVIIWRKTEADEWVIGHRLRQEEALTAAGPALVSKSEQLQADRVANEQMVPPRQQSAGTPAAAPANATGVIGPLPSHQHQMVAQAAALARAEPEQRLPAPAVPSGGFTSYPPTRFPAQQESSQDGPSTNPPGPSGPPNNNQPHPLTSGINQEAPIPRPWVAMNGSQPGAPQAQGQAPLPRPNLNPNVHLGGPGTLGMAGRPNPASNVGGQPNARVFKLQFDARRIICCSQDPKIVGWDFANNDPQIMESSRFFAAPQ